MDETPEKIVYFVRHGQSEGNITPVFQPPDSPLTESGKKQAALIAERIAKISFDTLIASPLRRTRDTCDAIAQATGKVPEYSDLLVERIKPSRLVGKSHNDKEANKLWLEWEKSLVTSGLRVEDGENYEDQIARADKVLAFLEKRTESKLVVVTHGYFLRTMIARVILGDSLTPDAFRSFQTRVDTENTGLSILKYGGAGNGAFWRLWIYNDHAHLG